MIEDKARALSILVGMGVFKGIKYELLKDCTDKAVKDFYDHYVMLVDPQDDYVMLATTPESLDDIVCFKSNVTLTGRTYKDDTFLVDLGNDVLDAMFEVRPYSFSVVNLSNVLKSNPGLIENVTTTFKKARPKNSLLLIGVQAAAEYAKLNYSDTVMSQFARSNRLMVLLMALGFYKPCRVHIGCRPKLSAQELMPLFGAELTIDLESKDDKTSVYSHLTADTIEDASCRDIFKAITGLECSEDAFSHTASCYEAYLADPIEERLLQAIDAVNLDILNIMSTSEEVLEAIANAYNTTGPTSMKLSELVSDIITTSVNSNEEQLAGHKLLNAVSAKRVLGASAYPTHSAHKPRPIQQPQEETKVNENTFNKEITGYSRGAETFKTLMEMIRASGHIRGGDVAMSMSTASKCPVPLDEVFNVTFTQTGPNYRIGGQPANTLTEAMEYLLGDRIEDRKRLRLSAATSIDEYTFVLNCAIAEIWINHLVTYGFARYLDESAVVNMLRDIYELSLPENVKSKLYETVRSKAAIVKEAQKPRVQSFLLNAINAATAVCPGFNEMVQQIAGTELHNVSQSQMLAIVALAGAITRQSPRPATPSQFVGAPHFTNLQSNASQFGFASNGQPIGTQYASMRPNDLGVRGPLGTQGPLGTHGPLGTRDPAPYGQNVGGSELREQFDRYQHCINSHANW